MAESASLVPVPFYAPVQTGTGTFFKYGETPGRPLLLEQQARTPANEPDECMAYSQNGCFVADTRIGTRVDVYA